MGLNIKRVSKCLAIQLFSIFADNLDVEIDVIFLILFNFVAVIFNYYRYIDSE